MAEDTWVAELIVDDPGNFSKLLHIKTETLPESARDKGEVSCCSSAHCCYTLPGALSEEDIKPIAEYLGITEEELYKQYLTLCFNWEDFRLLPVRKGMPAGGYTSMVKNRVVSPCIFLDEQNENHCRIHPVKPLECREYGCWKKEEAPMPSVSLTRVIQLGWNGEVDGKVEKEYIIESIKEKEEWNRIYNAAQQD